jgi:hypothetical protein
MRETERWRKTAAMTSQPSRREDFIWPDPGGRRIETFALLAIAVPVLQAGGLPSVAKQAVFKR